MRDLFVRMLARHVVLLAIAGLSCSYQPAARHAVGIEGGGQRIIPNEYVEMWDQTFTEEQWLQMLRQRIHQPIAIWQGIDAGYYEEGQGGVSFRGLVFRDSRSLVLERHLQKHDLMAQHPLMFLRLFGDPDPETVLAGVAAYRSAWATPHLETAAQDRIAQAFREQLLSHPDVRVRWAAVYTLAQKGWLTPQDVQQGLNDETSDIRVTTAFCLPMMTSWLRLPGHGDIESPAPRLTPQEVRAWRASLAPILLDRVNDPHFYVRFAAGGAVRSIFLQRFNELQGVGALQNALTPVPERFDWMTSDWQSRRATQDAWKQWWAEHGAVVSQ